MAKLPELVGKPDCRRWVDLVAPTAARPRRSARPSGSIR